MQLSIITPVYKVEALLSRCIDSILNQSFPDFELILVNDGSPDRCGEICDEYARKDNRIKVIHQKNQGQSVARNAALDIAQGEYIGFVDSDDYVHPEMFSILMDNVRQHNATISICGHKQVSLFESFTAPVNTSATVWLGSDFFRHYVSKGIPIKPWVLWDKIFHRSCFETLRFPVGRVCEDNTVVFRALYEAKCVVICDACLYFFYSNPDSTFRQGFRLNRLDWLKVLEEMIPYFEDKQDAVLVDKINRSYLFALTDLYQKVKQYLDEPAALAELKNKLEVQYRHEKERYPITIKTHPNVIEILRPSYAKCYWTVQGIVSRFKK